MKSENSELENLVKSLENNLTAQKEKFTDKISELNSTIEKLVIKNREKLAKVIGEYNLTIEDLKAKNLALDSNLTAQKEKQLELLKENERLKSLVESIKQKAIEEKEALEAKINELKQTVNNMLTVAEQKAIEASREYNATVAKFIGARANFYLTSTF